MYKNADAAGRVAQWKVSTYLENAQRVLKKVNDASTCNLFSEGVCRLFQSRFHFPLFVASFRQKTCMKIS